MTVCSLSLARVIPLAWGRAAGVLLARLALRLRPRERRLAQANLALVFPEVDDRERARLLVESVHALGRNFHDMLVIEKLIGDDRRIREPGHRSGDTGELTSVMTGLLERGRGLILLTGHFGCWELLGAWVARRLRSGGLGELAVVTGTIHNPAVDRLLQDRDVRVREADASRFDLLRMRLAWDLAPCARRATNPCSWRSKAMTSQECSRPDSTPWADSKSWWPAGASCSNPTSSPHSPLP